MSSLFRNRVFAVGNVTSFLMAGAIFAVAVTSAVFAAYGNLGTPAGVTGGFRPALAAWAGFALLAALGALAITPPEERPRQATFPGSPARKDDMPRVA